jgi:glycerate kinase
MRFIIAPDKFKGSIDAVSLCAIIRQELLSIMPDTDVGSYPMADGGDGFEQIIQYYFNTEAVTAVAKDPLGRSMTAAYQYAISTNTAFIEMSAASGLALLSTGELDPMRSSTFGTGMLIRHAIEKGARKVILGIGGSATNDAGTGMAHALGYRFVDREGNSIEPCGGNLLQIHQILSPEDDITRGVDVTVACDVNNPFFGPEGAAFIYGPQKGASPEMVEQLDLGLRHLDELFRQTFRRSVANTEGAGAAGGMGGGSLVFLKARLISGIGFIMGSIGLEEKIRQADVVITGEGCVDAQSFSGKVVGEILSIAKRHHKKVYILCGTSTVAFDDWREKGIGQLSALTECAPTQQDAIREPARYLPCAIRNLFTGG